MRRLAVPTLAAAVLLFPSVAHAQRYTAPDGKLRVALAQQPFSPNGTVPGPRTITDGGIQKILADLGVTVRVQEAALTKEENTEYGGLALAAVNRMIAGAVRGVKTRETRR